MRFTRIHAKLVTVPTLEQAFDLQRSSWFAYEELAPENETAALVGRFDKLLGMAVGTGGLRHLDLAPVPATAGVACELSVGVLVDGSGKLLGSTNLTSVDGGQTCRKKVRINAGRRTD